ncbi:MAG: pitrilysin family protein [Candidatus Buchananbacteria bacterium]
MYNKTKLKNGLTLITAPLPKTQAVTVLVVLPVGSRYETQKNNGVSHFIEHLVFKGTKCRPTSLDITKELDSVGAEYNAYTSKDHTGFHVKVSAQKIELAFDILSDMLFNSNFDLVEINKERGVILEEINMYEDNPMMYVAQLFEKTIFANQPLGRLISGPKTVIKEIPKNQILGYKNKFYQPSNMVVTVAGNFSKKQVLALTKKYFGQAVKIKKKIAIVPTKIKQNQPQIALNFKKTEQVQACLGFLAYRLADPKIYPLYLLALILGGNMSSRLFSVVREQHGLAYYIKSDISAYQDVGSFMIQAGLDKNRVKQAISLILAELKKIKELGVTDKELISAKEFLKGKLILNLEDSENIADWYSRQELLINKIDTPAQQIKKIFAVTKEEVKKVAQELIIEKNLNLVSIGPNTNQKEFKKILKF